jgi:ATP-binding cassette, subfamily B, bacterial MsbA
MNNFVRALKMSLRYRWTIAGIVSSALVVAALWGGNIGAMWPVLEVTFQGKSLSQWTDSSIASSEKLQTDLQQEIEGLDKQIDTTPTDQRAALEADRGEKLARQKAEQDALDWYYWAKPWLDRYAPTSPFQTLVVLISGLMIGTIIKDLLLAVGGILVDRLSSLVMLDLRKQFYRRTLRMDLLSFGDAQTSDLLSRFTYDMDGIGGGISVIYSRLIREPLKLIACLVCAAFICWKLLVLSLVVAPLSFYLISRVARSAKRANRRAMEQMSSMYNILVETFSGIKVVKAFTMERYERQRFHQLSKQALRKGMRIALLDSMVNPITEVMGIFITCVAILAGAYLVLNQQTHLLGIRMCERPMTMASLLIFYGFLAGTSDPLRKFSEVYSRLQRASAAADRVYQMLDRQPSMTEPPGNRQMARRHHRELVFDNISFSYTPEHLILDNVSLRMEFGETIAIVGANGCGKSTLANLVPRFFDPKQGSVRIDGVDVRDMRLRELRQQIGLVTQETVLFDDTVYNNIRYGAPSATRAHVIEAAKQAHAHKFIESRLEHGYDTRVGSQGNKLSGGQRQRIALARAILRDPTILILDEATSQIDLESEQLIHKVLEDFTRNRTTIIITHRLATLALADRIVVMHEGRIIDTGSHNELVGRCDPYRRLHEIQFRQSA